MRTLQNISTGLLRVVGLQAERPYQVSAEIVIALNSFYANMTVDPGFVSGLRRIILSVDKAFPWADSQDNGTPATPSGMRVSNGEVVTNNRIVPEKQCLFSIAPQRDHLSKGQLYAFEKYVMKIAEELARQKIGHVAMVSGIVKTSTVRRFDVNQF